MDLFKQELIKAREVSQRAAAGTLEVHEKFEHAVYEKSKIVQILSKRLTFATQDIIMGVGIVHWPKDNETD